MIVRTASPDGRLAGAVRFYRSRQHDFAGTTARIALPARTDVLLEFYFTAPHRLEFQADGGLADAPWIAAVGPQTHHRVDLLLGSRLDTFTIHFTPMGLHALIGIPMPELTDDGIDAAGLFGDRLMRQLHERLAAAGDFRARSRIADAFLLDLWSRRRAHESPVVSAALAAICHTHGRASSQAYAHAAGLSERHFRRLFERQIGITPKLYARIVRLEGAMRAKDVAPDRSWTDIAHDGGWFDQAHMDKDFRALTGAPPTGYRPRPV